MSSEKKPPLNEEDRLTWVSYTQKVKPLQEDKTSFTLPIKEKKHFFEKEYTTPNKPKLTPFHTPSSRDLKNVKIEARLDLHGHTVQKAHEAVLRFIQNAATRKLRCVLIITGKGTANTHEWWQETGVLRNQVPRWFHEEPICSKITSHAPAKPEHGGHGAMYVFLKKHKL